MQFLTDYKAWLGAFATFLTIYAYIPYLRGIFSGKTKPHLFTWLVWAIVTSIAAIIQIIEGGKAGSWSTALAALLCWLISYLAIKRGTKDVQKIDWVFLVTSLASVPLWIATKDPTFSALLITAIEIAAAFPTMRKSWTAPEQEVLSTYVINGIRFLLSIIALSSFTISTVAYPVGMILMSVMIATVLILRRSKTTQHA